MPDWAIIFSIVVFCVAAMELARWAARKLDRPARTADDAIAWARQAQRVTGTECVFLTEGVYGGLHQFRSVSMTPVETERGRLIRETRERVGDQVLSEFRNGMQYWRVPVYTPMLAAYGADLPPTRSEINYLEFVCERNGAGFRVLCEGAELAREVPHPLYAELAAITRRATHGGFRLHHDYDADHIKATQKSIALLKDWLTPEQLAEYEARGSFVVTGGTTGKQYRINPGAAFNVDELNAVGGTRQQLCFLPGNAFSQGDIMLAQKIALEQNEMNALAAANTTNGFTPLRRAAIGLDAL